VLHADELTYSVTLPEAHPLAAGGIMDTYLRLSAALLAAIQSMGIPVIADPEGGDYIDKGPVCFEVPSKYEITVNGRKLIGSAQMRRHHGVLQHGSLPLHGDLGRICDALVYPSSVEREHAKDSVRARAITLQEAGVVDVEWWHVAHIMAKAFSNTLHVDLVEGELSHTELTLADQLYRETYSTPDWNLKR
jgi:lipoate-protein ligase A